MRFNAEFHKSITENFDVLEKNGFQIWNQRLQIIQKIYFLIKQQKSCPPVLFARLLL